MENLLDNWPMFAIFGAFMSWGYKILNDQIKRTRADFDTLKSEHQQLKSDFDALKKSEWKWYQKYQWLVGVVLRNKNCTNGHECTIYKQFTDESDKNGVI